jgi:hypothetical protein
MAVKVVLPNGQTGFGKTKEEARFNATYFPVLVLDRGSCKCPVPEMKSFIKDFCTRCGCMRRKADSAEDVPAE